MARHADLLADEIVDRGAQRHRLASLGRRHGDREHHLAAIAEGLEPEQGEAARRRPGHLGRGDVARGGPVDGDRNAGIAGRAPIGVPPRLKIELEAHRQALRIADRGHRSDQPGRRLVVALPRGGQLAGACARTGQAGDRQRQAEALQRHHHARHTPDHSDGDEPGMSRNRV